MPATENGAAPCPRCQRPLIDPNGLGWCRACGYCRSLDESEKTTVHAAAQQHQSLKASGPDLGAVPTWIWATLFGVAVVSAANWMFGKYLPMGPFGRALFATLQIATGIGVMFIGQFMALIRIAPEDSALTFKDAIFPFRLYSLILKRLPVTKFSLYLGAWGLAAALSAGFLIGGLGHWFTYLPGYKAPPVKKGRV
jgi:hypothetical protein